MSRSSFTEDIYSGGFNWHAWRVLLGRIRGYARSAICVVVAAILMGATHVAFGLLVGAIIDHPAQWTVYAGLNVALILVSVVGVLVFILAAGKMASGISCDLRRDTFGHIQELSFGFYDRHPVGWLVARLTTDCDRLARIMAWGLLELTWGSVFILMTIAVMLVLSWRLALVALAITPVIWLVSVWFQRRLLKTSRDIRRTNSRITSAFGEGIDGVRATRTLVREEENLAEFDELSGLMFRRSVVSGILKACYLPVVLTLASLSIAATLVGGGWLVNTGLPLGTLAVFVLFVRQVFRPVTELSHLLTEVQHACAAAERITGLLETRPEIEDLPGAIAGEDVIEHITFRDVHFRYGDREDVIRGFNIEIARGQTVALVGPTGGGKSTLVSLLCRFYQPTAGRILVDGVDYTRLQLAWLQSRLGIVLQSPHLFSGTILDNIRYGRPPAGEDEVAEAARLACAEDFILSLPEGYRTRVGESGSALSVGQRQLVTLARAVLADPQIFVMDEATASVDSVTERAIQKGLAEIIRGRISLVIAHRLSTVLAADRIIFIEGGRIVESGTHAELMARRGRYYRLYRHQFSAEQIERFLG